MICVCSHADKKIVLFIKEGDKPAVSYSSILDNPKDFEELISRYKLALDIANKVVVITTQVAEMTDATKPFNFYCAKVLRGGDFKIERDLANAVAKQASYTFEEFCKSCKDLYYNLSGQPQVLGVMNSPALRDNTVEYGNLDALTLFKPELIEEETLVEEDSTRIMDNEYSKLNLEVPSLYEIWQIFGVDMKDRDIIGMREVTRSEKLEGDSDVIEMTYEEPEYAVTYDNIDGNIIFNVGVFNRNLARDLKVVDRLMNTDWSSQLNADDIRTTMVGTKENSFLPIQNNEMEYFENMLELAKNCLIAEHYDNSKGILDLRKDIPYKILNYTPIGKGIDLKEASQYVDTNSLIEKKVKSDLFTDYILWLADLALCATRPHLGFIDYPDGYNLAIEGAMADIRGEILDEDDANEKPKFNADTFSMKKIEALNYRRTLVHFLYNLPSIPDQISAIIKMLRWGGRKCSHLNVEGEPNSLSLEAFNILFVLDDSKAYEDEVRSDGSNRYITQIVLADSDITDSSLAKSLGRPAKHTILGFNIRKKYKGISAFVDTFVDLATIIDEYVNNDNKSFKISGIDYDKINCEFIVNQELLTTVPNSLYHSQAVIGLSKAMKLYNKGMGTIDLVISPLVGEILNNESKIGTVKYNVANFFTAFATLSTSDNILQNVKNYTMNSKKLYKNIMMTARTGAKVKYMNIALMSRMFELFKCMINISGECVESLTDDGVTLKDNIVADLLNNLKAIKIPTGAMSEEPVEVSSNLGTQGSLGQIFLDRIGSSKEVLTDARVFVNNKGEIIAYGVKPVSPQEKFFIKLYNPELVEVKSTIGKHTPLELLLKKLILTIKDKTKEDKMKLFRIFYAKVDFQSEEFRDYLRTSVVDWTKWV